MFEEKVSKSKCTRHRVRSGIRPRIKVIYISGVNLFRTIELELGRDNIEKYESTIDSASVRIVDVEENNVKRHSVGKKEREKRG